MEALDVIEKKIEIPGLKKSYRILHVTDVHMVMWDERTKDDPITNGPFTGKNLLTGFAVNRVKGFTRSDGVPTYEMFRELCDFLKNNPTFVDAVVLTGDILDFYTTLGFEFMVENLNKLPMPYMFVVGNHDYIFANEPTEVTFDRFAKLCGGNYRIQKLKLGELTLVGAYNGKYYYDDETLSLIEAAIENEEHALLFQHVPINSPSVEEYFVKIILNKERMVQ